MTTMDILKRTKSAWPSICNAADEDKNRILSAMADSLQAECDAIPVSYTHLRAHET